MRKSEAEAGLSKVIDLKDLIDQSTISAIKKAIIKQALIWIEQWLTKLLKTV